MVYPCLCFCHYSSITHLCLFVVFFVKLPAWVWSQQCVHTANTSSCAQGRCYRERGYKFQKWNFDAQLSRSIVRYNEKWFNTTFVIPVCIFFASCTGVYSLWTSLTILALPCFFSPSLISLLVFLLLSLRIPCFFLHILYRTRVCMLYSALEFVYSLGHLSLSIIQHLSLYFFYITLELVYISQLSLWIISHLSLYMILHWTLHVLSHLIMYIIAHWSLYLL